MFGYLMAASSVATGCSCGASTDLKFLRLMYLTQCLSSLDSSGVFVHDYQPTRKYVCLALPTKARILCYRFIIECIVA
jgi:hypothetical protein